MSIGENIYFYFGVYLIEKSRNMVYNLNMGNVDRLVSVFRELRNTVKSSDYADSLSKALGRKLKLLGCKCATQDSAVICKIKGVDSSRTTVLTCAVDSRMGNDAVAAAGAMLLDAVTAATERKPDSDICLVFPLCCDADLGELPFARKKRSTVNAYALRTDSGLKAGRLASSHGTLLSGCVKFDVTFTAGKRLSDTEQSATVLDSARHFADKAALCNVDCRNNTEIEVGCVDKRDNAVSVSCSLYCFDLSDTDKLVMRLESVLVECDNAYGTEHRLVVSSAYPPVVNNPALLGRLLCVADIEEAPPRYASESFGAAFPSNGCMCVLGCGDGSDGDWEIALEAGSELFAKLIFGNLKQE